MQRGPRRRLRDDAMLLQAVRIFPYRAARRGLMPQLGGANHPAGLLGSDGCATPVNEESLLFLLLPKGVSKKERKIQIVNSTVDVSFDWQLTHQQRSPR